MTHSGDLEGNEVIVIKDPECNMIGIVPLHDELNLVFIDALIFREYQGFVKRTLKNAFNFSESMDSSLDPTLSFRKGKEAMEEEIISTFSGTKFQQFLDRDDPKGLVSQLGDTLRAIRFEDGSDILIQAAKVKALKTVKELVSMQQFEERLDHEGRTALYYAAKNRDIRMYAFLAEAGWNVSQKDNYGQSPGKLILNALIYP